MDVLFFFYSLTKQYIATCLSLSLGKGPKKSYDSKHTCCVCESKLLPHRGYLQPNVPQVAPTLTYSWSGVCSQGQEQGKGGEAGGHDRILYGSPIGSARL